jgi:hypothetical protein
MTNPMGEGKNTDIVERLNWAASHLEAVNYGVGSALMDEAWAACKRAADILPLHEACVEALRGIGDDYMTSERHHPGYVLIPTAKFEQIQAALSALDQAITQGATP